MIQNCVLTYAIANLDCTQRYASRIPSMSGDIFLSFPFYTLYLLHTFEATHHLQMVWSIEDFQTFWSGIIVHGEKKLLVFFIIPRFNCVQEVLFPFPMSMSRTNSDFFSEMLPNPFTELFQSWISGLDFCCGRNLSFSWIKLKIWIRYTQFLIHLHCFDFVSIYSMQLARWFCYCYYVLWIVFIHISIKAFLFLLTLFHYSEQ